MEQTPVLPDPPMAKLRQPRRVKGFTLVEVMIAISVVAFSVLPIVALMPQGSDSLHISIRQNAETRIRQEIIGRLSATDWGTTNCLSDLDQSLWFFNENAAPVETAKDALYTVCLSVSDYSVPGAQDPNVYLRSVVMKITDLPEVAKPFESKTKHRCYSTTIARMDK